jgi:acetyltransferase-like isoleucine patch superfamily enzyme
MLAGELYDPLDPELVRARERARDLCQTLNATREGQQEERRRILCDLFGRGGETVWMQPPFFCDYGSHIELGERVFFNFNCVVLDVCAVRIGSYSLFGPAVQILHADASARCRIAPASGVWKAGRDWSGRVGGRRRHHPAGRHDRIARRHRRR